MSVIVARLSALPRSRWIIAGLSILMTVIVMTGFMLESRSGYSGRVLKVVFFQSWPANRSVADVHADRAAEESAAMAAAAQSRAYIATLPKAKRGAAQAQYDAFISAQPKNLQPAGFIAHAALAPIAPSVPAATK